ncbi:hypothetical protein CERSUDRAFT_94754 [Gelatoporia subvermispora B]|uniref:Velvet domain-containing protein n=1 Tax=Ceriporiopsis subvermispora (strain B) TaxID=914234 RepID=M2RG15_CERS8|nr:hypothetical protein CERSUDRAFT_94754 [Gelatoporia subvermispora B]
MLRDVRPLQTGSSAIGEPVTFVAGQFAGQTIRTQLEELQKADLGRKYARKDRRPVDPPPVVRLRMIRIINYGTPDKFEEEITQYDDLIAFGLTCHLDLFPIRGENGSGSLPWENMGHTGQRSTEPSPALPPAFAPQQHPAQSPVMQHNPPFSSRTGPLILDHMSRNNHRVTAACPPSPGPSSEVAVQLEGTFILRYRAFNVFAQATEGRDIPAIAECYGGPFRIYSTKDFPGLRASTDLTKCLSLLGVRAHVREQERKRRKNEKNLERAPDRRGSPDQL